MASTLDNPKPDTQLSVRTIRPIVVLVLLTALLPLGWGGIAWYRHWQTATLANAYRLIDCDVPGTEVYFREKRLGTVPLILSQRDCVTLGLPVSLGTTIDVDGWGEGVAFHDPATNTNNRLMYRVPSSAAPAYLSFETPWGSRTKMGGGRELPNGFRARFLSRGQDGIGVVVRLDFPAEPDPSGKRESGRNRFCRARDPIG
jgi:hypothetical protein